MEAEKEHDHILKGLDAAFKEAKQAREGKLKGRIIEEEWSFIRPARRLSLLL